VFIDAGVRTGREHIIDNRFNGVCRQFVKGLLDKSANGIARESPLL
jgi:hypothetical protein